MMQVWVVVAVAAVVVALVVAGVAGAACWWGCVQRRTAKRWRAYSDGLELENGVLAAARDAALEQVEASVAWLTADLDAIGEDR